ncbi:MAG TPA: hypothetical protein VFW65_03285 [Pseudonocardiaceae bacterium]|nr:hypothetical protein [Pseudonocardiaceae bacterium]
MTEPDGRGVVKLMRAVAMLAMPAPIQADYLNRIGTPDVADELALELDDTLQLADKLRDHGYLTDTEYTMLHALNRKLDSMSGHNHEPLWRTSALAEQSEWQQVRAMAQEFLQSVG